MVQPLSARNLDRGTPMSTRSGRAFSFAKEKTGESDSDFNESNDDFEQNYLTECLDIVRENANALAAKLKP